ncbi:hypothetical protein IPA_01680 [Ignicoccus pacificus DSM 13166]|uniref:Uncharacterized protein n=1 Tax=Ignicoccus pacificus DSM 13166 TaxID=940294 RepID=A0A977KC19_9CREN|nr:hypothetical protein IPA_01680 [Ignicoccus pacificus DSM 13166]
MGSVEDEKIKVMYEARKKLVLKALEDVKELIPISYVLACPDTAQWIRVVIKFKDPKKATIYATDLHDYIYTRYHTDPKFFVVDRVNPSSRKRLFEDCEFIFGDEREYEEDKKRTEEEARRFLSQIELVRRLYSKGSEGSS